MASRARAERFPRRSRAALAAIAAADLVVRFVRPRRALIGVLDELAHAATGLVALERLGPVSPEFARGFAAGTILLDVDHVPDALGFYWLRTGEARPYTHSLMTVAVVLPLPGVAAGLAFHLLRDLATGQGVMLLWPLSTRSFQIPYAAYFATLAYSQPRLRK